jgi:hypothetical protein
MAEEKPAEAQRTCFVVMGFGKKMDLQSNPNRLLDLDKTYRNVIKPAAEEAGLKCIRADEIVHSGLIDVPMYEQLLSADVVIADLSTANNNAFYELGVRHALRPYTTIIIAEDQFKFPFDLGHILIRQYKHLGEGIEFEEVLRFRKLLKDAIEEILKKQPRESDSPVYAFLDDLNPPERIAREVGRKMDEAQGAGQAGESPVSAETHSQLMQQVEEAHKKGDYEFAKMLLTALRKMRPDDTSVVQRLVTATFKSAQPSPQEAYEDALELLKTLHPETSNDPRTLGLWGTVHEWLWKKTNDRAHLDEALRAYERSFNQHRDYFNGIHEAFLRNVRAAKSDDRAEAIADFVIAQRLRREVIPICEEWLKSAKPMGGEGNAAKRELNRHLDEKSWVLATIAEAYMGMGDELKAQQFFDQSEAVIRELIANGYPAIQIERMRNSTQEKRAELQALLAASPLKYIKTDD